MAKRRGNQEGAIYQKKNGRWQAQVSIGGRRISKSFPSKKESTGWIREVENQKGKGLNFTTFNLTFRDFFQQWLSLIKPRLRIKTWLQYKSIGDFHLLPKLGRIKLAQLTPTVIQGLYAEKLNSGVGTRSVQLMHAVLRNSLGFAERQGIIPSNPTKRVDKPAHAKTEMLVLNDDQVRRLLTAAAGHSIEVLLQLAIATGMRQGELLGLKWSDVDWASSTIKVQRQLQRIQSVGLVFTQPKSKASVRTIQLGSMTLRKLMEHKDRQDQGELIFPSSVGTPMEPRILLAQFKALLRLAGLPKIRFHDLRHTAASLMLMSGMNLMRITRQLGHSKPSITLDIYGHLIPGLESESAERLDELITPTIAAELQQQ